MNSLLFVDDDKNILKINRSYFEEKGFLVYTAVCFDEAMEILNTYRMSCAVLDILMPENNGFVLCEKIRESQSLPIIFLTSLSQKDFLYRGFTLGGDDFMTKPYDLLELEMRIIAAIKHTGIENAKKKRLEFEDISIDAEARTVLAGGSTVSLTAFEFDILYLLASTPEKVFSAETIYRSVWQLPDLNNAATVQVHIARLRHKLEEACPERPFLTTTWKKGYKFIPNN